VPALRSLARHADGDGHGVSTPATPTTRTLAWALMINFGWTLLSWLVVIAGPYLTLEVAARQAAGIDSDPKGMWPIGDSSLPSPLRVALELGGRAATSTDLLLVPVIVLVTFGLALLPRRRAGHDRLSTLARGAVIAAVASGLSAIDLLVSLTTKVTGVALSVTAIAGAALVVGGFGLPRRWRIALGLLATAALAVAVTDNTFGSAMVVWFRD
jgi:hypothetical protein